MKFKKDGRRYMLSLSRGEECISTLTDFCSANGVRAAAFQAVGAVKEAEIGYYDLAKREYFFKVVPEDCEVASMTGNVALVDGKPFIHAHVVLSANDDSLACAGGHLKEATVAVTLEVFLIALDMPLTRKLDDAIGLKLLSL